MEEKEQGQEQNTTPKIKICIAGHLTREEVKQIEEASRHFVLSLRLHKIYEEGKDGDRRIHPEVPTNSIPPNK